MAKTGLPLRTELDGVWYLESHPQVAEYFKTAQVFDYCEKLTSFNQPLAEAFALSYNGKTVKFGREEFHVDEAAIAECTGLPRTGQSWFKTTKASDIEFRSYLLPAHKETVQRRDFPITFLEPQWQTLLKAIFVYITCEGRYHRVLHYHFKLLNHFTGRVSINLPFFFHKTLTKMAKQVQARPSKVASRISHQGLVTLIIKELLKKRGIDWNYFLFWHEFPTELTNEGAVVQGKSEKSSTPNKRKRRAISPQAQTESPSSSSKKKRAKKKLVFEPAEGAPQGRNPLNLPYSGSESGDEGDQREEQPMEGDKGKDLPSVKTPSLKPSTSETSKSNKLLQELSQAKRDVQQVKMHNAELIGRNMALHDQSQEIVEKFKKTTERNAMLIRENAKLYRTLRMLRLKLRELEGTEEQPVIPQAQPSGLDTLAEVATIPEEETPVDAQKEQPVEAHQKKTKRAIRRKGPVAKKP